MIIGWAVTGLDVLITAGHGAGADLERARELRSSFGMMPDESHLRFTRAAPSPLTITIPRAFAAS
jgi:hypothetical protein